MTIFPDDLGLKFLYAGKEAKKRNAEAPEAILGVPALTPSIIVSLQAMEVVKIILKGEKFSEISGIISIWKKASLMNMHLKLVIHLNRARI